jgi:hypothetical protein
MFNRTSSTLICATWQTAQAIHRCILKRSLPLLMCHQYAPRTSLLESPLKSLGACFQICQYHSLVCHQLQVKAHNKELSCFAMQTPY